MKFSEQWLREWVNPPLSTDELVAQITMAGLEVDAVEPVAGEFSGVVVAEVLSAAQHPDADKLSLCEVNDGDETVLVVCGAANVREGLKIAFARVGAVLPGNFKIKKAKLRGVESCGMICAAEELGLAEQSDGVMELAADAPVGTDLREYLDLNDQIIEVDLTPNRGDCLGIAGLAREVAVLNELNVETPVMAPVLSAIEDEFPVELQAPAGCSRYCGRVIRNVEVAAQTPLWMQEKLRRSGIRSIDPVVDVTNYVLLELGQPMHAFDLAKLAGGIQVRFADGAEKLTLLDGKEITPDEDILLIADQEKALAMAGIMGGEGSGVTADTRDIFLESAYFDPITIAGKARRYGLHTDSSHRFERGVDYQLQRKAIERATELLLEIVGGEPGPVTETVNEEHLPAATPVSLRKQHVSETLGLSLDNQQVAGMLERLGLAQTDEDDSAWHFTVPSHRFDVAIEADLVEEVARIYGYNNLPVSVPEAKLPPKGASETHIPLATFRQVLVNKGYQEAITYSFVEPKVQQLFDSSNQGIELANPISADMAVMRTSLWPGLVQALLHNQNRQQSRIRLFEAGLAFAQQEHGIEQQLKLAGLVAGTRGAESWTGSKDKVDFYDLKADVEALLELSGAGCSFAKGEHEALHPGQTAHILKDGEVVGVLGALHPQLEKALGVDGQLYLFELSIGLLQQSILPAFKPLSKFPEVRRDLAVIVDKSIQLCDITQLVRQSAGEWLQALTPFDVYEGPGVDEGKKSVALGLIWQHPDKTLLDEEIDAYVTDVVGQLKNELDASLRG